MNILEEANELVNGDRQAHYGHPSLNHGCTAEMVTSYLERKGLLAEGAELDARDICMINILQKVSRDANYRKRDNLVDIAGFALNSDMVGDKPPEETAEESADERFKRRWEQRDERYSTPVVTDRVPLRAVWPDVPAEFPLKWMDEADDVYHGIRAVRLKHMTEPERLFVAPNPKDKEAKIPPLTTVWGIQVEIDRTLPPGEFVIRIVTSTRTLEYHHFHFGSLEKK